MNCLFFQSNRSESDEWILELEITLLILVRDCNSLKKITTF